MGNINDNFFDGYYKDIWRAIIPDELTIKETDFMVQYFGLKPGSKVLDLMCGYGRHALALGRKGIEVTAVDNLGEYIDEITETAGKEALPVKAVKADIIEYKTGDVYDLALCMGNSLNFFDADGVVKLLSAVASQLKPGGSLLINTWSLAEIVIGKFTERTWSTVNGIRFLNESKFLFYPSRIETESILISPQGDTETKKGIDYIFSVAEMKTLLENAGFALRIIYSIPGRKEFNLGEPRAYIVADKK
jgi:SAM-dependent methyltransferase